MLLFRPSECEWQSFGDNVNPSSDEQEFIKLRLGLLHVHDALQWLRYLGGFPPPDGSQRPLKWASFNSNPCIVSQSHALVLDPGLNFIEIPAASWWLVRPKCLSLWSWKPAGACSLPPLWSVEKIGGRRQSATPSCICVAFRPDFDVA